MKTAETVFVVPTYRLRDVAETIENYDEHFWSNGHSIKMMVSMTPASRITKNISADWNAQKQTTNSTTSAPGKKSSFLYS